MPTSYRVPAEAAGNLPGRGGPPVRVAALEYDARQDGEETRIGFLPPETSAQGAILPPRGQTGTANGGGSAAQGRGSRPPGSWPQRGQLPSPLPTYSGKTLQLPLRSSLPPDAVRVDAQNGLVSIVARDAPLNEVLGALAQQEGVNVITAEDITARVSVTLHHVPFDQALTHILSVAGYTWVRQDDILIITSVTARNKFSPYAQGREVRVFPLDYVSATDIDLVIKGLLSPAGQSFVTQGTDSDNRKTRDLVVVEDLPVYLDRIDQYVQQVDQPPRQVLIEVHVLSVELTDDLKYGINLEYLNKIAGPSVTLRTQGLADLASFSKGTSPAFFFNLAASDLKVLLEALETSTDAKTLATPKVLALNGQKARIQVGEQLGYRVTTTTQTSTLENVEFLDVGVVLIVTPRISRDGSVLMQVKPKVSKGQINPVTTLPEEKTTEVETSLMLPDGQGMLIGGLIQEGDSETQNKIPVLGDLWLVGRLFQNREVNRKRTEIIIALIPHVVPYQPCRQQAECEQFRRATTPLLYGPLLPVPRPSEPKLPDAGQRLPCRYKLQHFRVNPDDGAWRPRGSTETCAPGPEPVPPGQQGPLPPLRPIPQDVDALDNREIVPPAYPQARAIRGRRNRSGYSVGGLWSVTPCGSMAITRNPFRSSPTRTVREPTTATFPWPLTTSSSSVLNRSFKRELRIADRVSLSPSSSGTPLSIIVPRRRRALASGTPARDMIANCAVNVRRSRLLVLDRRNRPVRRARRERPRPAGFMAMTNRSLSRSCRVASAVERAARDPVRVSPLVDLAVYS